jgi:putative pyruvate formate lyase activating enzyme
MAMLPLYLEKLNLLEIKKRVERLYEFQKECMICPRQCLARREMGEVGECRSTSEVVISSVGPHFGEEPPLVGTNGSGTIFFTNCNLKCEFCQNYDISKLSSGYSVTINELAESMLKLQNIGCHNINLVTPTHFTPQIIDALYIAIDKGLEIPLLYNCGGYESVETLKLLDGLIDIYMPDIKYSDNQIAEKYSGISNYLEVVKMAVKEMHNQVGDLKLSNRGIVQRGLLIRHLILPNGISGSNKVIDFISEEISTDTYINIMDQYHPTFKASRHTALHGRITREELLAVVHYAESKGLRRGLYN